MAWLSSSLSIFSMCQRLQWVCFCVNVFEVLQAMCAEFQLQALNFPLVVIPCKVNFEWWQISPRCSSHWDKEMLSGNRSKYFHAISHFFLFLFLLFFFSLLRLWTSLLRLSQPLLKRIFQLKVVSKLKELGYSWFRPFHIFSYFFFLYFLFFFFLFSSCMF